MFFTIVFCGEKSGALKSQSRVNAACYPSNRRRKANKIIYCLSICEILFDYNSHISIIFFHHPIFSRVSTTALWWLSFYRFFTIRLRFSVVKWKAINVSWLRFKDCIFLISILLASIRSDNCKHKITFSRFNDRCLNAFRWLPTVEFMLLLWLQIHALQSISERT